MRLNEGGTAAVQARAIPNTDNGGNGTGGGGTPTNADLGNPTSSAAKDAETEEDKPAVVVKKSYTKFLNDQLYQPYNGFTDTFDETILWSPGAAGEWNANRYFGTASPKYNYWTTRTWNAEGTGQSDEGQGGICGEQSGGTVSTFTMPNQYQWPGEYCDVEAYRTVWNGSITRIFDRIRRVQTTYELRTGGKAKYKGSDRLIIITASGFAIRNPFWRQQDPESTHDGYLIPKGEIEVGTFGPCLEPNGKLYVALPPNTTYDITPRSKGISFIDWTMPTAIAYDMVVTNFATIPEDRNRTTVGVGEVSTLRFDPELPIGVGWSVGTGGGSVFPKFPNNSTYTKFTAASNALDTIVVAYLPAPPNTPLEKLPKITKEFTAIEPSGVLVSVRSTDSVPQNLRPVIFAGFELDVVLQPTTVSFYKVQVKEPAANATSTNGYFVAHPPPNHDSQHGADEWHQATQDNKIEAPPMTPLGRFDHASSVSIPYPVNQSGSYSWPISGRFGELAIMIPQPIR